MIIGTLIFILLSLALLPIAYLIITERLLKSLCTPIRKHTPKLIKLADTAIFILFGIFILIIQVVIDTVLFISDLYKENLQIKFKQANNKKILYLIAKLDPKFYRLFASFLHQQKLSQSPTKKVIKELSQTLQIEKQIHNLLFVVEPETHDQLEISSLTRDQKKICRKEKKDFEEYASSIIRASTSKHVLQQFNILKRIINNNSIPNDVITKNADIPNQIAKGKADTSKGLEFKEHKLKKQITMRSAKLTNLKQPKGYIQNIFYIKEFLELIDEIQTKDIFKQMIE